MTAKLEVHIPLEHLASIVFPWWASEKDCMFGVLTAAFDASGDKGTPIMTVAGFISSVEDWKEFSRLWEERLSRENIEYFRAVEAAHFNGQFRPWKEKPKEEREAWRNELFSDLMDILKRNVYRHFGCSIVNSGFEKMNEALRKEFSFTAYSVAGRVCEKYVREWILREWKNSTISLELVFELGDDEEELRKRLNEDCCFPPIFRPKRDMVDDNGVFHPRFVPLQAADWYAYELSLTTKSLFDPNKEIESTADLRWPMRQFLLKPGVPQVLAPDDIKEFEKKVEQYKDLKNWWEKIKQNDEKKI